MDKSFGRFLFGDRHADRDQKFEDGIKEIEKKYSEYFKGREPKFPEIQKHDIAGNHYNIVNDNNRIIVKFRPESDLRSDIRKDIVHLADSIFGVIE
jgi:hypothetical protein